MEGCLQRRPLSRFLYIPVAPARHPAPDADGFFRPAAGTRRDDTTAIVQASYIITSPLVEWKDAACGRATRDRCRGGANLHQSLIKKYATKTIGKQPIEVRKLPARYRSTNATSCSWERTNWT